LPKVSIIVPVYNVYDYIDQCINSLINQTFEDIEIIIINDGSTDNVEIKLSEWQKKDERIKIVNNENRGVSYSRNYGISLARGEFISFVDPDDWCDTTIINKLYSALNEENADYVFCDYYNVLPEGKIEESITAINLTKPTSLKQDKKLLYNMYVSIWNKMYRKSLILDNDILFDEKALKGSDLLFTAKVLTSCKKIVQVKECLYFYRKDRPLSLTDFTTNRALERKYSLETTIKYFIDKGIFEEYYYELEKHMIGNVLWVIDRSIGTTEVNTTKTIIDTYLDFLNHYFPNWRVNMYFISYHTSICKEIGFFEFIYSGRISEKPIVIFSASSGGEKVMKFLSKFNILPYLICDNSSNKQNTSMNGVKIVSPEEMVKAIGTNINLIIASATYYNEIRSQMMDLGVSSDNIILCERILFKHI
jgi:glycosyltransferase EpsH